MPEIDDQLAAWADAAVPPGLGEPVIAEEVLARRTPEPAGAGGRPRRWLLAAAAVVVVAGLAAVVVATRPDDTEPIRADQPTPTTSTAAPDGPFSEVDPTVAFEVLRAGPAPAGREAGLRAAQTEEQFDALWADALTADQPADEGPPEGMVPVVDFDRRAVVGITVPAGGCPLELVGVERRSTPGEPDALVPRFRAAGDVCTMVLVHRELLVALDWADIGDRAWVLLPAEQQAPEDAVDHRLLLDRARPEPVIADLRLDEATVPGGSPLTGTLTVSNRSGAPIPYSYCGAEFALGLENEEVQQNVGFLMCLQGADLAPGTTTFPIVGGTSYGGCSTRGPLPGVVECLEDGRPPPLPPGEYRTRIYPPAGLDVEVPPLTVTVTAS